MFDDRTLLLLRAGYSIQSVKEFTEILPDSVLSRIAGAKDAREAKQTLRDGLAEQKASVDIEEEDEE